MNFYSVHLGEEELSELERFFEKFPEGCEYDEDIDTIIAWLDRIGESGALERYFRYEGKFGDGVSAIPIVDTGRFISSRLSNGTLYIVDKEIIGNLNFTRDEKK